MLRPQRRVNINNRKSQEAVNYMDAPSGGDTEVG